MRTSESPAPVDQTSREVDRGTALSLGGMQLPNFFQLDAQAVAKGAFGPQFFQERLGLVERVGGNILAFEHVSETALYFILGEQGDLPLRVPQSGTGCSLMRRKNHPLLPDGPGLGPVVYLYSIGGGPACKAVRNF